MIRLGFLWDTFWWEGRKCGTTYSTGHVSIDYIIISRKSGPGWICYSCVCVFFAVLSTRRPPAHSTPTQHTHSLSLPILKTTTQRSSTCYAVSREECDDMSSYRMWQTRYGYLHIHVKALREIASYTNNFKIMTPEFLVFLQISRWLFYLPVS